MHCHFLKKSQDDYSEYDGVSLHAANMVVLFGYKIGIWMSVP